MFLFADSFFSILKVVRQVWFYGFTGTGKSLACIAVADEMVRRGIVEGVVANIPHGLRPLDWREVLPPGHMYAGQRRGLQDACVIYDEVGRGIDARNFMNNDTDFATFARRLNTYTLMPSITPPDKRLATLRCKRLRSLSLPVIKQLVGLVTLAPAVRRALGAAAGLGQPIWIYKADLIVDGLTEKVETKFWIVDPIHRYGPLYDNEYPPIDDGDIQLLHEFTMRERVKNNLRGSGWYVEKSNKVFGLSTEARRFNTQRELGGDQTGLRIVVPGI